MKLIDNVHFFLEALRIAKAGKYNPAIKGRNGP